MPEAKTKPTAASIEAYLDARASAEQRPDAKKLMALLRRVTGAKPVMWGPSIVGFGLYRYKLASGKFGESCVTGFAIRGRDFVVYLMAEDKAQQALLRKLGPHKMGKSCLYFRRLADIDVEVLEQLVAGSIAGVYRRHPQGDV